MIDVITSLPVLLIEAHSRCNCRCVMCDIWKSTDDRQLSVAQLEAQLGSLERLGTQWVVFTGGEPLMNPNFFALADLLKRRGIRVTILSSGLLFERYAREIVEHIDDVIVSLDGPPDIHNQIRGIPDAFRRIGRGVVAIYVLNPDFAIAARCTVQRLDHASLLDTVQAARNLNLASISFLAADLTSDAFNRQQPWNILRQSEIALSEDEIVTLDLQIDRLLQYPFVIDSPRHLRRITQHFRAHLGLQQAEAPRCNAPWVSAVMGGDGSVRPCFFQPTIGSLNADPGPLPLHEVMNSAQAQAFRRTLDVESNSRCKNCVCSLYR